MRRTILASAIASVSSVALVVAAMGFLGRIDAQHADATMNLNAAVRKVSLIRGVIPELLDPVMYGDASRWQRQLTELTPILNAISTFDEGSDSLKARILEEHVAIEALFANLARADGPSRRDREIITGQLDVRTASMVSDILAMNDLAAEHIIGQKRSVLAVMALSVLALAGVIVALLIVLQRRVVSPVVRLQRAVARFSQGELDEPIPVSGTNEVSALAAGFEYMRKSLHERMAELNAARSTIEKENETLAQRVDERTAQLSAANRELERASRAKDLFLATMSHEIRTPMNGVVGMVEVLSHSGLSEHQADLVATIRDSASTLLTIIDDILDYSKIEAGRLDIEHKPLSVSDLVEGLCNSLAPVAAQRGVDLSLYLSPEIPGHVLSDDVRLRQIVYNLVGNAIKFSGGRSEKRGHVLVRADVVHKTIPLTVAFQVQDNGIGISPETQKILFRPFTQAELSTTRLFGGTGLGLAICHRLVTLMHGEIDVQSRLGEGSTFSVVLPFDVPVEQPLPSLPDVAGVECVLVRSEWREFEAVHSYLQHAKARVVVATDLSEAASLARAASGAVVIQGGAPERFSPDRLHQQFAPGGNARHVIVMRGQNPQVKVVAPDLVIVNGDALRRKVLIRAVAVAAGRASPDAAQQAGAGPLVGAAVPSPSPEEARTAGRLILVAEDDDINQKVILQQLALLGHVAEVAANGAEAFELWRRGRYGLLLTDLHMPEMDGYGLSQSIRQVEETEHLGRLPIVALTANALRGEEIRIRAAGMDDYLTKPASLELLKRTLDKWLPAGATDSPTSIASKQKKVEAEADFDLAALRDTIGEDEGVAREFLVAYLTAAEAAMAEMRAAGDYALIVAAAHRLKSSSRSIGALRVATLCGELESAAQAQSRTAVDERLASVEVAIVAAKRSISAHLSSWYDSIGNDHEDSTAG